MKGCRYISISIDRHLAIVPLYIMISVVLIAGCSVRDNARQPNGAGGKITSKKGDIIAGERIYNKYCFYCHGREGRGDGAIAIGLTPRPVDFVNDLERMKKSNEALFESISKGIHRKIGGEAINMPQWELILKEDEIWSVLAYVRYLSEKGRMEKPESH